LLEPLLWILLLIVVLEAFFGVDAYAVLDSGWLLLNLILGLAVIPLAICMSKRYADRLERSPMVQRFMKDIAGHSLSSATRFLAKLKDFEKQERDA
jgi:hypothetical protein